MRHIKFFVMIPLCVVGGTVEFLIVWGKAMVDRARDGTAV